MKPFARSVLLALGALVGLSACAARPLELSVDVRTDLRPGVDFSSTRVEVTGALEPVTRSAEVGDPYERGVRVADYRGLSAGRVRVRAALLDPSGAELVARRVDLALERDQALTVVLGADCVGRRCPGSAEPASFTECLSGRCVDPACGAPRPSGCGELTCASGADCGWLGCLATCIGGACVCVSGPDASLDASLEAGLEDGGALDAAVDAGWCSGECAPGVTAEETRACGACGEGLEQRTRTCGGDCRFGAFSAWSACATSATCSPGETDRETRACGNCNLGDQSRTRSCDAATCRFGPFGSWTACSGGGACAAGAIRTGCDPCGVEVCSSSCTWGACQPAAGHECLRIRPGTTGPPGNNYRCCGSRRWQFCLDTCQWSSTCEVCSSCC